jgi:hypothetical protein
MDGQIEKEDWPPDETVVDDFILGGNTLMMIAKKRNERE